MELGCTIALVAGAASAAPIHPVSHTSAQNSVALTIQYRAPNLRDDFRDPRDFRGDRWERRNIVSDRVILATLRNNNLRAISNPRLIRDRIVVQATGRFGRVVTVTFHPYTGRIIGMTRR